MMGLAMMVDQTLVIVYAIVAPTVQTAMKEQKPIATDQVLLAVLVVRHPADPLVREVALQVAVRDLQAVAHLLEEMEHTM